MLSIFQAQFIRQNKFFRVSQILFCQKHRKTFLRFSFEPKGNLWPKIGFKIFENNTVFKD
jgi:hypothetical protein